MHVTPITESHQVTRSASTLNYPLPWFAVRVREKFRNLTEERLSGQFVEFFSPVTQEMRQWSDRQKMVTVPLFAGYLFCRFDPQRMLMILQTQGVIDILRCGARLAEVDAAELEAVGLALKSSKHVEGLPYLMQGQLVRVVHGPMSGVTGVLVEQKSQYRLVLAVTMMNRSVSVEIDRMQVEVINN